MLMPGQSPPAAALSQPWRLPPRGLAVFHGERHAPRLSHYFMPSLALEGKRILFLDGANCADPRLMKRLAEQRGLAFTQFNRQIMLARAFTCFQLTELICRVPQFLAEFPAEVVIITAFPELYFDEDVRHPDAVAAFQQGLKALMIGEQAVDRNSKRETRREATEFRVSDFGFRPPAITPQPPVVALFSAASSFQPPAGRQRFFPQTCAVATELWTFHVDEQNQMSLVPQDRTPDIRSSKFENRNSKLNAPAISAPEALARQADFRVSSFELRPATANPPSAIADSQ
jgi:hypothetical protein